MVCSCIVTLKHTVSGIYLLSNFLAIHVIEIYFVGYKRIIRTIATFFCFISSFVKCMEYDDSIVRQMVECIKAYPGGKLEIIFGGGYLVEESV